MMKFFGMEFGGKKPGSEFVAPRTGAPEISAEDREQIMKSKWDKFVAGLTEHCGRPVTETEVQSAKRRLLVESEGAQDPFAAMVGEEIRQKGEAIAEALGLEASWVPGSDVYEPMGTKQVVFEQTLMDYLGRAPNAQELADARMRFEMDKEREEFRAEFAKMVGEQVRAYATDVATRLGWEIAVTPMDDEADIDDANSLAAR